MSRLLCAVQGTFGVCVCSIDSTAGVGNPRLLSIVQSIFGTITKKMAFYEWGFEEAALAERKGIEPLNPTTPLYQAFPGL
jgi:hypothetical protein